MWRPWSPPVTPFPTIVRFAPPRLAWGRSQAAHESSTPKSSRTDHHAIWRPEWHIPPEYNSSPRVEQHWVGYQTPCFSVSLCCFFILWHLIMDFCSIDFIHIYITNSPRHGEYKTKDLCHMIWTPTMSRKRKIERKRRKGIKKEWKKEEILLAERKSVFRELPS